MGDLPVQRGTSGTECRLRYHRGTLEQTHVLQCIKSGDASVQSHRLLASLSRPNEAVTYYRAAIGEHKHEELIKELIGSLLRMGQLDEARRAALKHPSAPSAQVLSGIVAFEAKQHKEAQASFAKALKHPEIGSEETVLALVGLARIQWFDGRPNIALQ